MYIHYLVSIESLDETLETINENKDEIISASCLPEQGQMVIICKAEPRDAEGVVKLTSIDRLKKILGDRRENA